jgi:hypothetical protein
LGWIYPDDCFIIAESAGAGIMPKRGRWGKVTRADFVAIADRNWMRFLSRLIEIVLPSYMQGADRSLFILVNK